MGEQFVGPVEIVTDDPSPKTLVSLEAGAAGGGLEVRSEDGRPELSFDGDSPVLYIGTKEDRPRTSSRRAGEAGISITGAVPTDEAATATGPPSMHTTEPGLIVRDMSGRDTIRLRGGVAKLQLGVSGNGGEITMLDKAGREALWLDADQGVLRLGSANRYGDLVVVDNQGREVFRFFSVAGYLHLGNDETDGGLVVYDGQGHSAVEINGMQRKVEVYNVNGEATVTLVGDQGDILLAGADCAERFELADGIEDPAPGTVVVLAPDGGIRPCDRPYDRAVAGVISGAGGNGPGIVLGSGTHSRHSAPVALAGKVHCFVDAERTAVGVGDLLTTGGTSGHATAATDRDRAFGAVLGKALAPMTSGRGLLPILVSLR